MELVPIRVNCISSGLVPDSPIWKRALAQGPNPVVDAMTVKTPTRRLAMTEGIIQGVFFLIDNKTVNSIDLELEGGIQIV